MVDDIPLGPAGADLHGSAPDRLNSWKEIAAYLGKGVRTVQRWEAQMGLPIRRLGREGGEIIYALKSEIDAWILKGAHTRDPDPASAATQPPSAAEPDAPTNGIPTLAPNEAGMPLPRPAPPGLVNRSQIWLILILVGLGGIAMTLAQRPELSGPGVRAQGSSPSPGSDLNPVGAAFEGHVLRAWGQDGRPIWTARIEAPNDVRLDTRRPIGVDNPFRRIAVEDLDGDGRNEVLLLTTLAAGSGDSLRVLNADGSQRFTHVPGRPVTYGAKPYQGFNSYGIHVIPNADGPPTLFLIAANVPWFPSVLEEISPNGEIRSEYWSNGHIFSVRPATLRGRALLLVGAYNNERRGGSLAVLDRHRPGGTAPAENPNYRCTNCAEGDPVEFLVFPATDLLNEATSSQGSAVVVDARVTGEAELVVSVRQASGLVPGETIPADGSITYTLSAETLGLRQFLPGWGFLSIHNAFQRARRLNHPFGAKDEAELAGIVRWRGGRFVPLRKSLGEPAFARAREAAGSRAGS